MYTCGCQQPKLVYEHKAVRCLHCGQVARLASEVRRKPGRVVRKGKRK